MGETTNLEKYPSLKANYDELVEDNKFFEEYHNSIDPNTNSIVFSDYKLINFENSLYDYNIDKVTEFWGILRGPLYSFTIINNNKQIVYFDSTKSYEDFDYFYYENSKYLYLLTQDGYIIYHSNDTLLYNNYLISVNKTKPTEVNYYKFPDLEIVDKIEWKNNILTVTTAELTDCYNTIHLLTQAFGSVKEVAYNLEKTDEMKEYFFHGDLTPIP